MTFEGVEQMAALYQRAMDIYVHRASTADLEGAAEMFHRLDGYENARAYEEKCRTLLRYDVGNTVVYGRYGGESIRWRVLGERGRLRLLFAEKPVTARPYNDELTDTSWKECSLRKWLNHDFMTAAFTPEERARISTSIVHNGRNPKYFTNGGFDSADRLFVPDMAELDQYLPDVKDRVTGAWWWLRTPGCNLLSAVSVYGDGSVYDIGIHVNYAHGGVRPAMWVLLRV